MKFTLITLFVLLTLGTLCRAQSSQATPPGIRHAQELQATLPGSPRSMTDPGLMQREADEIASLAATVPPGVQKANKGLLAKDLIQRLKQIEKLSKHLRNQLDH